MFWLEVKVVFFFLNVPRMITAFLIVQLFGAGKVVLIFLGRR